MPELPEVETVKETLKRLILNKTILSVDIYHERTILSDIKEFKESLKNETILNLSRKGKFLIFHLTNDKVILSHLRMEGKFFLKDENEPLTKHDLVVFHFSDNSKLLFNDTRRFGIIKLTSEKNYLNEHPLSELGPDGIYDIDPEYIFKRYKNKSLPIKSVLLDQSIIAGIGNIYADEILFASKIHPLTKAKDLSLNEIKTILRNTKEILNKAIELGGSTIKSYHPSQGVDGEFQINLKVYGKKDGVCPSCHHYFRKIFVGGRGTTYCPYCQKIKNLPFVIGLTGKTASGKSTAGKYLKEKGFFYLSSDEGINELYEREDIISEISTRFYGVVTNKQINKTLLREKLTTDIRFKIRFENYIHSVLYHEYEKTLTKLSKDNVVVLEVPLLYEANYDSLCDKAILITTDKMNQKERISSRGVDVEKAIKLNENFKEEDNKKKADFIVINNNDLPSLYKQLDIICDKVKHH